MRASPLRSISVNFARPASISAHEPVYVRKHRKQFARQRAPFFERRRAAHARIQRVEPVEVDLQSRIMLRAPAIVACGLRVESFHNA